MKKIFLTSGIVVCIACPAFAYDTSDVQAGNDACVVGNIGVTEGSTTLLAKWRLDAKRMRLSSNQFDTNNALNTGGASTNDPFFQYTPNLYVSSEEGKVYTLRSGTGGTTNVPAEYDEVTNNTSILTATPAGIEVAFVPHLNLPSGYTNVNNDPMVVSSTAAERQFRGYFLPSATDATSSNDACITRQGVLKIAANSACLTSLSTYDANDNGTGMVWKAMYRKARPTLEFNGVDGVAPSIYGYTFNGWALTENDANNGINLQNGTNNNIYNSDAQTGYVIAQDTDVWGSWTPNSYNVTYSCNGGTGSVADATATFDAPFTWAGNDDTATGTGCKKSGYHFTGWTCTVAAAGTVSGNGKTIISNGGVACAANATNPGECTGQPYSTPVNKWTETDLVNGATIACVANWTANTISIVYNSNSGSAIASNPAWDSCTYDGALTLPTEPTRAGYTFDGWEVVSNNP